jgi:hypothetical protein
LKEYTTVYMKLRVRASGGFNLFDKELNKLAMNGWVVKFSNISVIQQDTASHFKEPSVAFYALLEREKHKTEFYNTSDSKKI